MPWNLFDVFVIVCEYILLCTVWSCWVKNIHHSFVGWTGIQRSCPQLPSSPRRIGLCAVVRRKPTVARRVCGEKAPEVKRRCTRQRGAATSQLWSFWSPEAPRWTPRATVARASIREAGARNRVLNLGHFKIWQKCFGLEITAFSVNVWQSRGFALLMLGSVITNSMSVSQSCSQKIDDHLTSYMTFLMTLLLNAFSIYEQKLKYYRLCFIEGNLSETRCIETCSMCLWMVFCFAQFDCVKTKNNVVSCRLNRWSSAEILNLTSGHLINYLTYLMTLFLVAFSIFGNKVSNHKL